MIWMDDWLQMIFDEMKPGQSSKKSIMKMLMIYPLLNSPRLKAAGWLCQAWGWCVCCVLGGMARSTGWLCDLVGAALLFKAVCNALAKADASDATVKRDVPDDVEVGSLVAGLTKQMFILVLLVLVLGMLLASSSKRVIIYSEGQNTHSSFILIVLSSATWSSALFSLLWVLLCFHVVF